MYIYVCMCVCVHIETFNVRRVNSIPAGGF